MLQALDAQDFTTQPPPPTLTAQGESSELWINRSRREMLMDHIVAKVKTVMLDLGIGHGEAVTHDDWKGALVQRAAAHLAKHKGAMRTELDNQFSRL